MCSSSLLVCFWQNFLRQMSDDHCNTVRTYQAIGDQRTADKDSRNDAVSFPLDKDRQCGSNGKLRDHIGE